MKKKNLYILVACEESQAVTKAFLDLNKSSLHFKIEAYSCDLLPSSGGLKNRHFNGDVFEVIEGRGGINECGEIIKVPKWDMMIAHPPCTYLAVSGAKWYYHPADKDKPIDQRREHPNFPGRRQKQRDALDFFKRLFFSDIPFVAIENPVSIVSSKFKKPNDKVQPWQFGEPFSKTTCLWTRGPIQNGSWSPLPKLKPTKIVDKGERVFFKSGKSQPKWYSDALVKAKTQEERRTLRSKTFKGIASAIALQYTSFIENEIKNGNYKLE